MKHQNKHITYEYYSDFYADYYSDFHSSTYSDYNIYNNITSEINDKSLNIKENINSFVNQFILLNNFSNANIYYYEIISDTRDLKNIYSNITFIDFPQDTKTLLINNFNLNENDKIYLLIIHYLNHDINAVTNNFDYKLFLENGTELNISSIKEDFYANIYLPLEDFTLSNYDYYLYFSKQGYDIYDKKGNFYNDICSPAYLKENDITIPDRKKDIYPNNATICKDNCEYKGVISEEKRIICKCNLNHNNNNNNKAKEEDNFLKEENNDNFFSYLLDKINYKIFKCYKLFIFDKMKKSYVFYATLFLLIIIALNIFIFYIFVIPKLRQLMYKQIPSLIKLKEDIIKEHNRQKNLYRDNIIRKKKKKKGKKRKIIFQRINSIDKVFISSNSKIEMNSSSIQVKKLNDDINIKEDINELPFTQAIKKDKRHFFEIFKSIIIQKIELINLICGDQKIKILLIYQYI